MKILLRNIRLLTNGPLLQMLIDGSQVAAIEEKHATPDACHILDCDGLLALPGLIDLHVHFREPGQPHKETIETGSAAAARGGVTTVGCMPNTTPPIDTPARVWALGARRSAVRILPIAALTRDRAGTSLVDLGACRRAGAVAFSDDGTWLERADLLANALEFSKTTGAPIISHCETPHEPGSINEGEMSRRLETAGISTSSEIDAIARDIDVAEEVGGHLHLAHVSCAASLDLVRTARRRGIEVTCEVAPHHFLLDEELVEPLGSIAKVNPPLRTSTDKAALLDGLIDGTIDMIATDHAPHSAEEKALDLEAAPFGISSIEMLLPLLWSSLVVPGIVSLERMIELTSTKPAQYFGLPSPILQPGNRADIVLFNPNEHTMVETETFLSKGRNCPYAGWTLDGRVVATILGGELSYGASLFDDLRYGYTES